MSVLLAILALGLLIVVHEFGHYFVARLSGMRVERFSLGFGPPILSWRNKETQFQVAPIPLGGFVQITGMNPHEDYDEHDPRVYPNRPTYQRFLTIFAGPAMNYVLAIVMIFAVFVGAGLETGTAWWKVESVTPGKPAESIMQPGDRILAIDGQPVWASRGDEAQPGFRDVIQGREENVDQAHARPITLHILRRGQEMDVSLTPTWREAKDGVEAGFELGIALDGDPERVKVGVAKSAYHAVLYPWVMSGQILDGLWKVVTRQVKGEVAGPVGITQAISQHIKFGWVHAFGVLAMLNVYLGLFNLLPLPALDGGRLVFLGYELATRRRPNPRVEAAVHMVGFAVLLVLMLLVTFKDIKHLFT